MSNLYQYNGKEWIEIAKDGSAITGESIVAKINDLPTDVEADKIDIEHIRGLRRHLNDIANIPRTVIAGGGLSQVYHDSTLTGDGTQSSPLRVVSSGGGVGAWSTPPESVAADGSVTVFTVGATAPTDLVSDGIMLFDGFGYTYAGTQVTLDNGPTQFIRFR